MVFKRKVPLVMYMIIFLTAVFFLVCSDKGSDRKEREQPKSFAVKELTLDKVDQKVLKEIDPAKLLAEDLKRGKNAKRPLPLRFAVTETVSYNLENSGTWQKVSDGRVWRLVIQTPKAKNINLGITSFYLPKGAKLWIYDPQHKIVQGPYTSKDRSRKGSLWTPIVRGDKVVVELFVPTGAEKVSIVITRVNKGYRSFLKGGPDKSGACNNDVVCPEGDPWRDQIRSVARYSISGTSLCTGQLVNNTSIDFTPYFLSANHCGVSAANDDTLVFYWNYESPNCGDQCCGSLADNQTGAIYRASYAPSDFLLVELEDDPDPAYNVFFTGWDATGGVANSAVCIHHPSGDEKAISFENDPLTSTSYLSNTVNAGANHWRVADWDDGTTEPGSSGACLWDPATRRCVGQLHGGYAACGNNDSDWYGKFSVSWTGGGTDATRLSNWLDPGNTGTLTMNGDPHIKTADGVHYDFQGAGEYIALRSISGTEIQVRQTPIATSFNPGANAYHGLKTCVSINTAVAARVADHRVTYQPNLSGNPDPNGLQLRIDGELTTLSDNGIDLENGGRISKTSAQGGIQIDFPDQKTLIVTPGWWSSQSKWYLNVSIIHNSSTIMDGASGKRTASSSLREGGIMAKIASGSWLPALPDGSTVGPMPGSLDQRYTDLYQKFGNAWRVTDSNSLFDYASGTTTATFTFMDWPYKDAPCVVPKEPLAKPSTERVARQVCGEIKDRAHLQDCIFDVLVTGETKFAQTYVAAQRVISGYTNVRVKDNIDPSNPGQKVSFLAQVRALSAGTVPTGKVQFILDGVKVGRPVALSANGQARWITANLKKGKRRIKASYLPDNTMFKASTSQVEFHTVKGKLPWYYWIIIVIIVVVIVVVWWRRRSR